MADYQRNMKLLWWLVVGICSKRRGRLPRYTPTCQTDEGERVAVEMQLSDFYGFLHRYVGVAVHLL